jgi:hypothetical protein
MRDDRVVAAYERSLSTTAKAFRVFHAGLAVVDLAALGYVWACGITGRRGRLLTPAIASLAVEGGALVVGRGSCPLGPLQAKLGDPIPLFELVLPRRAARAAVPVLANIAIVGMLLAVVRTGMIAVPAASRDAAIRSGRRRSRQRPLR